MSHDLIQYFQQVLGIREILGLPREMPTVEAGPVAARLLLFVDQRPWSNAARELFEKMKQAMRLENVEAQAVFTETMSDSDFQLLTLKAFAVVSFSEALSGSIQNENLFVTIGPEKLIAAPALKKQAWADLQSVMEFLAQSPVSNEFKS